MLHCFPDDFQINREISVLYTVTHQISIFPYNIGILFSKLRIMFFDVACRFANNLNIADHGILYHRILQKTDLIHIFSIWHGSGFNPAPLAITLWVISLIIGAMDQTLTLLPEAWQPERLLGFHLPGLGTLLTIAFI